MEPDDQVIAELLQVLDVFGLQPSLGNIGLETFEHLLPRSFRPRSVAARQNQRDTGARIAYTSVWTVLCDAIEPWLAIWGISVGKLDEQTLADAKTDTTNKTLSAGQRRTIGIRTCWNR